MGLGENLRRLREQKGYSKRKVADDLHIAYTTYDGWDKGRCETSSDNLKLLADYFHVSVEYLLYGSDVPAVEIGREPALDEPVGFNNGKASDYLAGQVVRVCRVLALLPSDQLDSGNNVCSTDWVPITPQSAGDSTHFAYRSDSDGLRARGISAGDMLIIRRTSDIPSGCVAAVYTPSGGMICLYYKVDGGVVLLSGNPLEPKFFKDGADLIILGRVMECRKAL